MNFCLCESVVVSEDIAHIKYKIFLDRFLTWFIRLWNFVISKKSYCYLIVYSIRSSIKPESFSCLLSNSAHCFACLTELFLASRFSLLIADVLKNLSSWRARYHVRMVLWGYQACLWGKWVKIQTMALGACFCSWRIHENVLPGATNFFF